jgi:hypothetical protein
MYVYAINEKYFGEPEEMTAEEVTANNTRLARMKLVARYVSITELVETHGASVKWFPTGKDSQRDKALDFAA